MDGKDDITIPMQLDFLKEVNFSEEDRQIKYSNEDFINMLIRRVRCLICNHYFHWEVPVESNGECWNCNTKYEVHEEENHWGSIDHGGEVVTVMDPNDEESVVRLTGQGGDGWAIADYLTYIGLDANEWIENYLY